MSDDPYLVVSVINTILVMRSVLAIDPFKDKTVQSNPGLRWDHSVCIASPGCLPAPLSCHE